MRLSTRGVAAALVLIVALVPAGLAGAQTGGEELQPTTDATPVVLVANSKAGTVHVVDANDLTIERTIDVLPRGKPGPSNPLAYPPTQTANALFVNEFAGDNFVHDLDLSPDGETLYASRGHMKDVAALDLTQHPAEVIWTATVDGFRADHMTIGADGDTIFISDLTEDQVIALDAEDGSRLGTVPTGDYAHGVTIVDTTPDPATLSSENVASPDDRCAFVEDPTSEPDSCLYAASIGDIVLQPKPLRDQRPEPADAALNEPYQLTIADADSLEVLRTLEFPGGIRPAAFDLAGDDRLMYYQESSFHGIVEYDLEDGMERRRVQLPIDEGVSEDDYSFEAPHHGLAISPDHSTLCTAGRASDYVALVSTDTMLAEAIVDVGDAPSWAITGPTGERCWVTNTGSEATDDQPPADTVSVIDYDTGQVDATIETDPGPKHVLAAEVPSSVVGSG